MRGRFVMPAALAALQLALLCHTLATGGIQGRRAGPGVSARAGALVAPTAWADERGEASTGTDTGTTRHQQQKSNDSPKGEPEETTRGHGSEQAEEQEEEEVATSLREGAQHTTNPTFSGANATAEDNATATATAQSAPGAAWPPMSPTERLARVAMLKRTILDMLGLERPPNVTTARPLPDVPPELITRLRGTSDDSKRAPDQQPNDIVVFAEEERGDCGPNVGRESCFAFNFSEQVGQSHVASVHLWVYVSSAPAGASVYASRPPHHYGGHRHVLATQKLYSRKGWVELAIPVAALKGSRRRHYLEIGTKGDGYLAGARRGLVPGEDLEVVAPTEDEVEAEAAPESDRRPMLLLSLRETRAAPPSRPRRSVGQCDPDQTTCCMRPFQVAFADIGWSAWIISPAFIDANYCAGTCSMESRNFLHDYTEMVAIHMSLDLNTPDPLSLCCVPDQMAFVNLLFRDAQNNINHRTMKLVVDNCGCI